MGSGSAFQVYLDQNLAIAFEAYIEANGGVANRVLKKLIRDKMIEEGLLNGPLQQGEALIAYRLRQQQEREAEERRIRENANQRLRRALHGRKRPIARRYEE